MKSIMGERSEPLNKFQYAILRLCLVDEAAKEMWHFQGPIRLKRATNTHDPGGLDVGHPRMQDRLSRPTLPRLGRYEAIALCVFVPSEIEREIRHWVCYG